MTTAHRTNNELLIRFAHNLQAIRDFAKKDGRNEFFTIEVTRSDSTLAKTSAKDLVLYACKLLDIPASTLPYIERQDLLTLLTMFTPTQVKAATAVKEAKEKTTKKVEGKKDRKAFRRKARSFARRNNLTWEIQEDGSYLFSDGSTLSEDDV